MEWTKKYYSEEARKELAQRNVPRELIEKGEREWAVLIKDIEAALAKGEDPASKEAQALVERWSKLLEAFTGGSRAVQQGLNKMYADQANWPSTFKKPYSDEVGAFICQAMALRKKG